MQQYIEDAGRTNVPALHGEKVPLQELVDALQSAVIVGQRLDAIKKALAYGKDLPYYHRAINGPSCTTGISHIDKDIVHSIIGICTEASELAEALLCSINTREPIDDINLFEEIGDIMWYQALSLGALGKDFSACAATNTAKVMTRFPEKYADRYALTRDLGAERDVLEQWFKSPGEKPEEEKS